MSVAPSHAEHTGRDLWLTRLRHAARTALGEWIDDVFDHPPSAISVPARFQPASFRDEFGQTRLVDEPLIAHLLNLCWVPPPHGPNGAAPALEWSWWCAVHNPDATPAITNGDGPLEAPEAAIAPIETWTERELAALHGAWHVAIARNDRALLARLHGAAVWHGANTQPDNATNHPWAIHVFIERAVTGDADAELLAQTLLHNCHVHLGRPDLRSGLILADAAKALYAASDTTDA